MTMPGVVAQKQINTLIKLIETKFVHFNYDYELPPVKPECDLINDLNFDSLSLAELTMSVEEKFDVELFFEEITKIRTVSDLALAINRASA